MGRWTYYSPLALGALLCAVLLGTYRELLPALPAWRYWLLLVGGCLLAGLICQLALVGAQGALAQVLPVPGGRSLRGSAAVLSGVLLLLALGLAVAAGLLAIEHLGKVASILAVLSGAAGLAAIAGYLWSLPAAVRDFAEDG